MTTFIGTPEDDTFDGSSGDDLFLLGSGGSDTASGHEGNDVFEFKHAFDEGDVISGGDGIDTVTLKGNYLYHDLHFSQVTGIEDIELAKGHSYNFQLYDSAVPTGGMLTVNGAHLGASDVFSFNGNLVVNGGVKLIGGSGNDSLYGGASGDILIGGPGADNMIGDAGSSGPDSADKFVFRSPAETSVETPDTIFWDPTTGDRIDLKKIDADSVLGGNQKFHFVGTSDFSGTPGELHYQASFSGYLISGDVDGDGVADFAIQANPNHEALPGALVAADFIL